MNQDSYNSNSLGFDQAQPPQSPVIHQPPQELSIQEMEDLKQQYLDEMKCLSNLEYHDEIKIAELTENFNGMSIESRKKEKLLQQEQWAYLSTHPSKRLHYFCFDDDDEDYTFAITPDEPSGVENLIQIPSESEGIPEHMCDVPSHDNSSPLDVSKDTTKDLSESNEEFSSTGDDSFSFDKIDYVEASPPYSELTKSSSTSLNSLLEETNNFNDSLPEFTTFSKVLFDAEYESDSSDDQSCSDEDVLEKIISKPLPEEEIRITKRLLYDNSSPRPLEEIIYDNSDADIESFSPSPIPNYSRFVAKLPFTVGLWIMVLINDNGSFTMVLDLFLSSLIAQTQLTTTLGRIEILEAKDPEPQEGPAEAGSSC
nr:hypothetical protein [Tanacetum cinerariifolium]